MVRASKPVASVIRLAARPVGAHSSTSSPSACISRMMNRVMVVLPVPGPPVSTVTPPRSASSTASR